VQNIENEYCDINSSYHEIGLLSNILDISVDILFTLLYVTMLKGRDACTDVILMLP